MQQKPLVALLTIFSVASMATAAWMYLNRDHIAILNPAGWVALQERSIIVFVLALSLIVIVPVFTLLFFFAWRYRIDNQETAAHYTPEGDNSRTVELVYWAIPTLIIIIASVVAWKSSHVLDPYRTLTSAERPLEIQVVALDWKWLFIYPQQHIASVNVLEIPDNTPVHFTITADAPMNSFWIPQLSGQIMAMPGMSTQLNVVANSIGTFNGFSANISGKGFSGMVFTVSSVSPPAFAAWVQAAQVENRPLTQAAYAMLAQPSEYNAPAIYSSVADNLYTMIVMQYMLPASSMIGNMSLMNSMPMASTTL